MAGKPASKERVLSLLKNNADVYISGELIARQLQLSRNAVWKAINALRRDGLEIDAVTNRGYCLRGGADVLSREGILRCLGASFPKDALQVYDELPSTSRTAKELALQGAPHGTVIVAGRQSAGAAREAGEFFSPDGGLYLSVLLRPAGLRSGSVLASARGAAAAVCLAIEEVCGRFPEIREVDDLYLDDKKICGILAESGTEVETGLIHWLVLGIGVRFSTPQEAFPEALRKSAGSIYSGSPLSERNQLAAEIIRGILSGAFPGGALEEIYRTRHRELYKTSPTGGRAQK